MPLNRNTLIRIRTIDRCLQNRYRKWTLQDLIDACSDALCEYEGRQENVSKRTVQADIQLMRSEKLGYNAPIVVEGKKYYTYADPDYSITNIPLNENDLNTLSQAMDILKHFRTFSQFNAVGDIISKLEEHISVNISHHVPAIDLEKNIRLKGLEYVSVLYQHILRKQAVEIDYQSFKADKKRSVLMSPYLLKEYRNRWFVIGYSSLFRNDVTILALDRIQAVQPTKRVKFRENDLFDPEHFFDHVVGVTRSLSSEPCFVKLHFNAGQAPYALTKPLHSSQQLLKAYSDGSVDVSLFVIHNLELERAILDYAEGVEVLEPRDLRHNVKKRLQMAALQYSPRMEGAD